MDRNRQPAIAAAILGTCVLGSAFLVSSPIGRAADQLAEIRLALTELRVVAQRIGVSGAGADARRGPDPDRLHRINTTGAPAVGPIDAKVTLVEFSDFECPFCARVHPTLERIREEYGDQVRIVFKHLPLSMHARAPAAHAATEAARLQGRFWEMHDKIFSQQQEMSEERYLQWAGEIGLDIERFQRDLASPEVKRRVEADLREANTLGLTGTPSFFLNGRYLSGAKPFSEFKRLIDSELDS